MPVYHPVPSIVQVPWTIRRGPSYWEDRLTEHYARLGVTLTEAYQRSAFTAADLRVKCYVPQLASSTHWSKLRASWLTFTPLCRAHSSPHNAAVLRHAVGLL